MKSYILDYAYYFPIVQTRKHNFLLQNQIQIVLDHTLYSKREKSQRGILLIQFKQITRGNQAWERHIREKKMLIAYQIKRM
jgi:hypothetical protein